MQSVFLAVPSTEAPASETPGAVVTIRSETRFNVVELHPGQPRLHDSNPLRVIEGISPELKSYQFMSIPRHLEMKLEVRVEKAGRLIAMVGGSGHKPLPPDRMFFQDQPDRWRRVDGIIKGKDIIACFETQVRSGERFRLQGFELQLSARSLRHFVQLEGDFEYAVWDNAATITRFTGTTGAVRIPETIGGWPVRGVGEKAFFNSSVTDVSIPRGIATIGDSAFTGCGNLVRINVDPENSSYRSTHGVLFDRNGGTLIRYPTGKPGTDYAIPQGVTRIGRSAFRTASLTRVIIPPSVTRIGWAAFAGTALTGITIPSGVTIIEANAFAGCKNLTSATFEGNAPEMQGPTTFWDTPPGFVIRYCKGASGFSKPAWAALGSVLAW